MQRPDRRHGIGSLCQADCFFHFRFVIHDNSARGIGRERQSFIFRVDCEFAFPGRSGDFQCLTPDGGHTVTYKLQKPYCDEAGKLCEVFVYKD